MPEIKEITIFHNSHIAGVKNNLLLSRAKKVIFIQHEYLIIRPSDVAHINTDKINQPSILLQPLK